MQRALLALAAAGALAAFAPGRALAFKPTSHLYTADRAVASILAGGDTVEIDGRSYTVPAAVATSIRAHPADYRGGVLGPDAFPDIPTGQGNIHPDTRFDNGRLPRDLGPGHSFTWQWLDHVYRAGWAAYRACNGCPTGQRDLAFTTGSSPTPPGTSGRTRS